MLKLKLSVKELYNEETNEFYSSKEKTVQLEHSLVSISKWEAKWKIPFLSKAEKTDQQVLDYINCMLVTSNGNDENILDLLTSDSMVTIKEYIADTMTATTIHDTSKKTNNSITTSEVIYYWMVAHNIPFECQKWHLNRLLTLISVCNVKNATPKKMSKNEAANRNRALNASRKQSMAKGGH